MSYGVATLSAADVKHALPELGRLLQACVADGASVGFVQPFSHADAESFWESAYFSAVETGGAELYVTRENGEISGCVVLGLDMMPNQAHRADVSKLLVHPRHRRKGLGRALMMHLIARAGVHARKLLVLDTRTGDPSQRLYENLGFEMAGAIPMFCRNPDTTVLESTTYMYRILD